MLFQSDILDLIKTFHSRLLRIVSNRNRASILLAVFFGVSRGLGFSQARLLALTALGHKMCSDDITKCRIVCVCATFVGVCCEALRVTTRLMILAGVKTWVFIREIAAVYQSHDISSVAL